MENFDHRFELEVGARLPVKAPYQLSGPEMAKLRKQLAELVEAGYLRPSRSPYATLVWFQHKKEGTLRLCVNYSVLNKLKIKNKEVFKLLKMHELYVKKEKCAFAQQEVLFLGHIVGHYQIHLDLEKLPEIRNWEPLCNVHEVRHFLGLANYYRKFVGGYSRIASPLTDLLKKDRSWKWGVKKQSAFDALKEKLTKEPVSLLMEVGVPNESDFNNNTLSLSLWKAESSSSKGVHTRSWVDDP
ncbi:uncharacterized mitochondrial protein AtMg00860-like [Cryptomeria japonica]|uniref:uncharacterized mitochondrial protein AtMg00860-like n=1 Tax=Cryptomeria japonica TaxID=3369 RepID=UPI0027D9FA27|nr:uncharacterized mitochondrial protein AtMg00860-like [Cryptomeria japonica]